MTIWRGPWDASTAYNVGDGVFDQNLAWVAAVANTGVEPGLDQSWSEGDPALNWRGAYAAGTAYVINDAVYDGGHGWAASQATTGNAPSDDAAQWRSVALVNAYQGVYSPAMAYGAGDVVSYAGGYYKLIVASATGAAPDAAPGDWLTLYVGTGTNKVLTGPWSPSVTYAAGNIVSQGGQNWEAVAPSTGVTPAPGAAPWTLVTGPTSVGASVGSSAGIGDGGTVIFTAATMLGGLLDYVTRFQTDIEPSLISADWLVEEQQSPVSGQYAPLPARSSTSTGQFLVLRGLARAYLATGQSSYLSRAKLVAAAIANDFCFGAGSPWDVTLSSTLFTVAGGTATLATAIPGGGYVGVFDANPKTGTAPGKFYAELVVNGAADGFIGISVQPSAGAAVPPLHYGAGNAMALNGTVFGGNPNPYAAAGHGGYFPNGTIVRLAADLTNGDMWYAVDDSQWGGNGDSNHTGLMDEPGDQPGVGLPGPTATSRFHLGFAATTVGQSVTALLTPAAFHYPVPAGFTPWGTTGIDPAQDWSSHHHLVHNGAAINAMGPASSVSPASDGNIAVAVVFTAGLATLDANLARIYKLFDASGSLVWSNVHAALASGAEHDLAYYVDRDGTKWTGRAPDGSWGLTGQLASGLTPGTVMLADAGFTGTLLVNSADYQSTVIAHGQPHEVWPMVRPLAAGERQMATGAIGWAIDGFDLLADAEPTNSQWATARTQMLACWNAAATMNAGDTTPAYVPGAVPVHYGLGGIQINAIQPPSPGTPFQGPPYVGDQNPCAWLDLGQTAALANSIQFLADAQTAYSASTAVSGPFAPVYVWNTWDALPYGTAGRWSWSGPVGDPAWGGQQYRAFASIAEAWYRCGQANAAGTASAGTVALAFLAWLDAWLAANPDAKAVPDRFPAGAVPALVRPEPHMAASALKAVVFCALAGAEATKIARVAGRLIDMLTTAHVNYGPMRGSFSPDADDYVFQGFWAGEIMDALALVLLHARAIGWGTNAGGGIGTGSTSGLVSFQDRFEANAVLTQADVVAAADGAFYPANNPAGYLTTSQLPALTQTDVVTVANGIFYAASNPAGYLTAGQLTQADVVNAAAGVFYPSSNPAGYMTTAQLPALTQADVVTAADGIFYPASNPAGYMTTAQLPALTQADVVTAANGIFYAASNPAGYIDGTHGLSLTGDITGSGSVTGVATTLSNTGVTAGTYGGITVDAKGRVTNARGLLPADLPVATTSSQGIVKIGTGLSVTAGQVAVTYGTSGGTAAAGNDSRITGALQSTTLAQPYGIATLDGTGRLPTNQAPLSSNASGVNVLRLIQYGVGFDMGRPSANSVVESLDFGQASDGAVAFAWDMGSLTS